MKARIGDSYTSNITPSTAFHIRNRYLSRVGNKVSSLVAVSLKNFLPFSLSLSLSSQMPDHVYSPQNPLTSSYPQVGVLK